MRDLGRRLLIGVATAAAAAMAVGYMFIFSGIAAPIRGDRATLDLPPEGSTRATFLDDGLPVFVVNDPALGVWVLDARAPTSPSHIGVALGWCPGINSFVNPADGSFYAANGELGWGAGGTGLVAFAARPAADDPPRVIVSSDTAVQGRALATDRQPDTACRGEGWVTHQPKSSDIFDPSVAIDREPLGWIWLEGTARVADDEVRLCDGLADSCQSYADTRGIDPASITDGATGPTGRFIGRARDDAIEGLIFVPELVNFQ